MQRKKAEGMLILIFVNVMWGLSFIFSKTALGEGMPAMTLAFLRYLLTAAILVPMCLIKEGSLRLGRWAPRALATTLLGITVYYFFEYAGLARTTASAASLILALVPMLTLLARVIFMRERIAPARWVCVLLSLVGVYFVIRVDGEGAGSLAGNLFMVAACLCWMGYILTTPRLMQENSSLRVTTWQAIAATLSFAPFAFAQREQFVMLSPRGWLCVLALAAICSALCYALYGVAIRSVDSLTVSLCININPIAACAAGTLMLHETLTPSQLVGGLLILVSVALDAPLAARAGKEKTQA